MGGGADGEWFSGRLGEMGFNGLMEIRNQQC